MPACERANPIRLVGGPDSSRSVPGESFVQAHFYRLPPLGQPVKMGFRVFLRHIYVPTPCPIARHDIMLSVGATELND